VEDREVGARKRTMPWLPAGTVTADPSELELPRLIWLGSVTLAVMVAQGYARCHISLFSHVQFANGYYAQPGRPDGV
jgi:hypothetical protein